MQNLLDIIKSIDSINLANVPNVNPTVFYNEGWMSRFLVHQSITEKLIFHEIDFGKISNWTSEALISSPFLHANHAWESHTHADISLGDFDVDYSKRGEIEIRETAKLFGIIEAKMGSNLSQATTYAKHYNQASRNLACIASNSFTKPACNIFFWVTAPAAILKKHKIEMQIDLNHMIDQIQNRFDLYSLNDTTRRNMNEILEKASTCKVGAVSYEDWISIINDTNAKNFLQEFYNKAKKWNRIKL